jgi:hypothetical protein
VRIHRRPRATVQAQQIQSWMTFRYINYVFNLPVDYLSGKLNIKNSGYPNITIVQYAAGAKQSSVVATALVRQAVGEFVGGGSK